LKNGHRFEIAPFWLVFHVNDPSRRELVFKIVNFRMLAILSSGLDHYYSYFLDASRHAFLPDISYREIIFAPNQIN
jgi:hypothetical protein